MNERDGATIFGYYVKNPKAYGVVEFDEYNNVLSIEEKPKVPKSNYAVPGLYFYDNSIYTVYKSQLLPGVENLRLQVSTEYLQRKTEVELRAWLWLDTESDGLMDAANFVATFQNRQGLQVSCIEEIAYKKGFIDKEQLKKLGSRLRKTPYGRYAVSFM